MRIVIYGDGAMAAYAAYRLSRGSHRTVMAIPDAGARFEELRRKGLRLRDALSGAEERVEQEFFLYPSDELSAQAETADALLVSVAAHRLNETLEVLPVKKPVLILGTHYMDREKLKNGMGPDNFLYAFPGSSAVRDEEGVVNYLEKGEEAEEPWALTIGRWKGTGGTDGADIALFKELFESSGLPVHVDGDMCSVLRSQNSVRLPVLAALQLAGGRLDRLSERGDLLKLMVLGTREALQVLRRQGGSPVPRSLDMYRIVPVFITANMIKRRFTSPASLLGIEDFGNSSVDETAYLAAQLLDAAAETGAAHGHLLSLFSVFSEE